MSTEFSPRAGSGDFSSPSPARFDLADIVGFAAYALAVGGGRPAFDFLFSLLGGSAPSAAEGEEALDSVGGVGTTTTSLTPPLEPEAAPLPASGPALVPSSQIESWQPPLVAEPVRAPVGVS